MSKQIYVDSNGNETEYGGSINYGSILPISPSDSTNTKDYIDNGLNGKANKTITCKMIQTTLTYNSSLNRFTLPSGVARPVQPQQCLIGRNSSSGAIYALWYVSTDENFQIGATLAGSAPANGNTCYVNYTVPNT